MTNLKEIQGLNVYCGPAVLSALTGKSTDECASVISSINGRREIKSVSVADLLAALKKLRFDCMPIGRINYSLFGTLNSLSRVNGFYVITVPRHVIAIEVIDGKIFLIDNHSKQPLPAESSARLTQKVELIYKVVKLAEPKFISNKIRVTRNISSIRIESLNTYEDENDNSISGRGDIYFTNDRELKEIINELVKVSIV